MLINGEKWACEACVRGHRVSNCQHSDRPLQHINKKGRPVSQCQHCRAMRKSRASHVKCDCGEKPHKCKHLKTLVEGHKSSCCCNHGGRCTCCQKKETLILGTVPESESVRDLALQSKPRSRRRANTTSADGLLEFDGSGHHKPTHKHAKASRECGPYQLPRANTLHNLSMAGSGSADSLGYSGDGDDSHEGSSPASSGVGEATSQTEVKVEPESPPMTGSSSFAQLTGQLAPLDLSDIKYTPYVPNSADYFTNPISDNEPVIFSAALSAPPVDWSNFDGLFGGKTADFAPSNYSQPQSYGGYDYGSVDQVPTLTTNTSTSGDVSEAGDLPSNPLDDLETTYQLGETQTGLLGNTDGTSLDFGDFRYGKTGSKYLAASGTLSLDGTSTTLGAGAVTTTFGDFTGLDEDTFWMSEYRQLQNVSDSPADNVLASYWDSQ